MHHPRRAKQRNDWHDNHPWRNGWGYDKEDRSPSPPPLGIGAFRRNILRARFPTCFRAPNTIAKYSGETNPGLWLEDYWLAYQAGGATDDNFIIRTLPLYLANSVW